MSKAALTVEYEYLMEEEDSRVRGNAMASGDAELDRQVEDEILADLDRGHLEAWCTAHVRAILAFYPAGKAGEWYRSEGSAYLGCCSYKTERELWESATLDYDLEGDARQEAAYELRGDIKNLRQQQTLTRLMAELERSETLKRLMARQKRAVKVLADPNHRQWAETELVNIDGELEKLG